MIRQTTSVITCADRRQHLLARLGWRRDERRVASGLYALGAPTPESPVFVTANYRLSMDALRAALAGRDAYILVLDTFGINVWCAAGKGTFGTDELVRRVEVTGLAQVVTHRRLILPQLGAAGVAAYEVKRRCGFRVEYGPVRAADLPAYLEHHEATPEMRRVRFTLRDRLVLIPVEAVHAIVPLVVAVAVLMLAGSPLAAAAAAAALLAGVVLFPILLPWLPTRDFSSKGFLLGGVVALAFAAAAWLGRPDLAPWVRGSRAICYLLALPPVTAFLALNFTGSTPFTSRTGVRREIYTYIPWMAGTLGAGLLLALALTVLRPIGG